MIEETPKTEAPNSRFIIKGSKAIAALPYWLAERKFNSYTRQRDRRGGLFFGLSVMSGGKIEERGGIVVLIDESFADAAEACIEDQLKQEEE